MNLNINDPAVPAPGEMQRSPSARSRGPHSPRHERAPSLGELHQELEYEQEGQVVCRCIEQLLGVKLTTNIESPSQHDPPTAGPDRHPDSRPAAAL